MSRQMNAAGGFTLIELLISTVILSTAIMSMFSIYSHILVEIRQARNKTLATNLAQAMMEMIVSSPYDATRYHGLTTSLTPSDGNPVRHDLGVWKTQLDDFPTNAIGQISAIRTETVCSLNVCPDVVLVNVTITYDDYGGEANATLSMKLEPKP